MKATLMFCKQHAKQLLPSYGVDLIAFLLFALGYWQIAKRLAEVLVNLNTLSSQLSENTLEAAAALTVQQQFMSSYVEMIKLSFLAIALLYGIWVFLFCYGLWSTYGLAKRTVPIISFLIRFALVNLAAVLAVLITIALYAQAGAWAMTNAIPGIAVTALASLFLLLLIGILYLTYCSYRCMEAPLGNLFRRTFGEAVEWRSNLLSFAVLLLAAFISMQALATLTTISITLGIVGWLIALLLFTFLRGSVAVGTPQAVAQPKVHRK